MHERQVFKVMNDFYEYIHFLNDKNHRIKKQINALRLENSFLRDSAHYGKM